MTPPVLDASHPRRGLALLVAVLCASLALGAWWFLRPRSYSAHQVMQEALGRVDDNRDGVLSAEEFTRYGGDEVILRLFDYDGSGALDTEEFTEMFMATDPKDSGSKS